MATIECHALLFDCDGVLIDSTQAVEQSWAQWVSARGLDWNAVAATIHGRRAVDIIDMWAPGVDVEQENREVQQLALDNAALVVPVPGAARLVSQLPADTWAVATSAVGTTASTWMVAAGVPLPAMLVSAEDVTNGKPAPDCYLQAARRLGVDPQECVVVEDAPNGISAARAAGMRVLGVRTTFPDVQLDTDWSVDDLTGVRDVHVDPVTGVISFEVG